MLKTLNTTGSSTISQLIDVADEDEIGENSVNRTNLSNSFVSKRSTDMGYLIFKGTKKGAGNTKNNVKAARGFDYLTPAAKKAFNHLCQAFTSAPIL